jgi:hypothetical protein
VKPFTQIDPLTDAEVDRLGEFLKGCRGGRAMNVALIAGPETGCRENRENVIAYVAVGLRVRTSTFGRREKPMQARPRSRTLIP